MKRNRSSDRAYATFARVLLGSAGFAAAILFIRSLPDLIRYIKMESM